MTVTITVLFPNEPDAQYDFDYYLNKHMPLIQDLWGKYGVKSWTATKFTAGPDGSAPQYAFASTVVWGSHDEIKTAFSGPEAGQIMGDVANFSNKQGVFLYGDVSA